ncbi:MAG TPA: hypothetical protein VMT10_10135 [Solirubrobacteraceae bacterium]|nr:hypothetical protein [Solirubrobacteraceae bacterium]
MIHVLVIANRTIDAPALLMALRRRAEREQVRYTLLVPARDADAVRERLDAAVATLESWSIQAAGKTGTEDPVVAAQEEYDNTRYDEILVVTLPGEASIWLQHGVPARVQHATDAVVHHITVPAEQAAPTSGPQLPPPHEKVLEGMLGLLKVDTNRVGHPYG